VGFLIQATDAEVILAQEVRRVWRCADDYWVQVKLLD
jgi:hypothetical protein